METLKISKELVQEAVLLDELMEAFIELAKENPQKAVDATCGLLVGLIENQLIHHGLDENAKITLDGGGKFRTITIEAARQGH